LNRKKAHTICDDELVSALKCNSGEAMGVLYDNYSAFLYGLIYRIVQSEQIAEDLLQEVFVKIWQNIGSYDSRKSKLATWMGNIARNLAIDKIRSKEYKNALQNRDISDYVNILEEAPGSGFNPEHIGVKDSLEKLEAEQKVLIDMVYFQGYTHAETAQKLGIPLGTVKTRIRSAISNLRKIFK
jgi:RNA polymerase sigma-70 factor (ECF subfamily)